MNPRFPVTRLLLNWINIESPSIVRTNGSLVPHSFDFVTDLPLLKPAPWEIKTGHAVISIQVKKKWINKTVDRMVSLKRKWTVPGGTLWDNFCQGRDKHRFKMPLKFRPELWQKERRVENGWNSGAWTPERSLFSTSRFSWQIFVNIDNINF